MFYEFITFCFHLPLRLGKDIIVCLPKIMKCLDAIHADYSNVLKYNDDIFLAFVLTLVYYSSK